jgi:hypothetical protein
MRRKNNLSRQWSLVNEKHDGNHKATHTYRFSRDLLFYPDEDSFLGHLQKIFNLMRKIQFVIRTV